MVEENKELRRKMESEVKERVNNIDTKNEDKEAVKESVRWSWLKNLRQIEHVLF